MAVGIFKDQTRSYDQKARLIKYSLNGMYELLTADIDALGHSNWISYNKELNELYVIKGDTNDILVFNFDTLSIKRTFNVNSIVTDGNQISSFTYDNKTGKYYVNTYQHSYEIDINTIALLNTITYEWGDYLLTSGIYDFKTQGCNIHNGLAYFTCLQPQSLVIFDIETGKMLQSYEIPKLSEPFYLVREPEEISINLDDDRYFMLGTTGETTDDSEMNISQFFKFSLDCNIPSGLPNFGGVFDRNLNVNANSTASNPDGSTSYPFKDIGEALDVLNNPLFSNLNLQLADGNYGYFELANSKCNFVTIMGNSDDKSKVVINKCKVVNSKLNISNVTFNNTNSISNYSVIGNKAEINIFDCDFKDISNPLISISYYSKLKYNNIYRNNVLPTHSENLYGIRSQNSEVYAMDVERSLLIDCISDNIINLHKITPDMEWVSGTILNASSLLYDVITSPFANKLWAEVGYRGTATSNLIPVLPSGGNDGYNIDTQEITSQSLINYHLALSVSNNTLSIINNRRYSSSNGIVENITSKDEGLYIKALYIES